MVSSARNVLFVENFKILIHTYQTWTCVLFHKLANYRNVGLKKTCSPFGGQNQNAILAAL